MVENCVFELGGKGVGKGLDGRLDVEGDERGEEGFDFVAGELGDMVLEGEGEAGADGFRIVAVLNDGIGVSAGAELNVAQEAMAGIGSAVEVENDFGVLDADVGDDEAVAGLGGEAFGSDLGHIGFTGGFKLAVGGEGEAFVTARERAHGKALLGLHEADEFEARFGIEVGFGERDVGRNDLLIAAIDGGGGLPC